MSEFVTFLAPAAYGTAAIVGMQLIRSSFSRLSRRVVRQNGDKVPMGPYALPQAMVTALVLLGAGLFLLMQGVAVVLWTFS